jgi:chitinase
MASRFLRLFFLLCRSRLAIAAAQAQAEKNGTAGALSDFAIAAYLPDYRIGSLLPHLNASARHLTDLVLFSVEPPPPPPPTTTNSREKNGLVVDLVRDTCCLAPEHYEASRQARAYKEDENSRSASAKQSNGGKGTKLQVWVTVGGGGSRSDHFLSNVAGKSKNGGGGTALARGLLRLAQHHALDGIDLDCEGFRSQHEYVQYLRWVNRTAPALRRKGLKVSLTLHPHQFAFPDVYQGVDRVHLMAYDMIATSGSVVASGTNDKGDGDDDSDSYHGSFVSARQAIEKLLESGCPPSKIMLGIPAYARHMSDPTQVKTFGEMLNEATQAAESLQSKSAIVDLNDNFGTEYRGYRGESPRRVRRKVQVARSLGLGGVFFWELGQDARNSQAPGGILLQAAAEGTSYERLFRESGHDPVASDGEL